METTSSTISASFANWKLSADEVIAFKGTAISLSTLARGITINAPLREIGNPFEPGRLSSPNGTDDQVFPGRSRRPGFCIPFAGNVAPASLSSSRGCTCWQPSGSHVGGKSHLHESFSGPSQVGFGDLLRSVIPLVVCPGKLRCPFSEDTSLSCMRKYWWLELLACSWSKSNIQGVS